MTRERPPSLEQRLAALHELALEEPEPRASGGDLLELWEHESFCDRPSPADGERRGRSALRKPHEVAASAGTETPAQRQAVYRYVVVAVAVAAAAVVAIGVKTRRTFGPHDAVASEELAARSSPGEGQDYRGPDPCRNPVRALGKAPLLDDFEDGNEGLYQTESRNGYWSLFEDTTRARRSPILKPLARPGATQTNRLALHVAGGSLKGWGASLQARFGPACYDVSAYRGVSFSALGPGRLRAAVGEVRLLPVEWGGTCTKHCYDLHSRSIELESRWNTYRVRWDELRRTTAPEQALDPTRVQNLSFLWQPSETPYDVWIDDVRFLE